MIDLHCHLDLYEDPKAVIDRAHKAGVYVLSVTTTPLAWPGTVKLAAGKKRIQTAVGLHPELAHERHKEVSLFEKILPDTKYVGEIGLDGSKHLSGHQEIQLKVLRTILRMSEDAGGKYLSIHSRKAASSVLECLAAHPRAGIPIMHWFTGTQAELYSAIKLDCWFSVGPAMLRSKSSIERVKRMPRNRLLLESDGPFGKYKGKPIEPVGTTMALPALAEIWNVSIEESGNQIFNNFRSFSTLLKRDS